MADLEVGKSSDVAAMYFDYRTALLVSAAIAMVHDFAPGGLNCMKPGLKTVGWVPALPD